MAIDHYENFPVASVLCPPALRPPITAIYHFARVADDIADEGDALAQQRLDLLTAYHSDLARCTQPGFSSARWPHIFGPLARQIDTFGLPLPLLRDLLRAFESDVRRTQSFAEHGVAIATYGELLDYCRLSANPIGRLLLHLYRIDDPHLCRMSDDICTALQLINFWQDLSVDIPRQRHYVPDDTLAAHGLVRGDLVAQLDTPKTSKLIAELSTRSRAQMLNGQALCGRVPGRAGWELRLVVQGGLRILEKIAAMDHRTLARRPKLTTWDAPVLLWRALTLRTNG